MPISLASGATLVHEGSGSPARTYPSSMLVWLRTNGNEDKLVFNQEGNSGSLIRASTSSNNSVYYGNSTNWGAAQQEVGGEAGRWSSPGTLFPVMLVGTNGSDVALWTPWVTVAFSPNNPNGGDILNCFRLRVTHAGHYAEIASWNSALTYAQYQALAAGAAPETVSPGTLYDCWDLNPGGTAGAAAPTSYTGRVNGRTFTASGTVTVSSLAHPITRIPIPTLTGSVTLDNMAPTGGASTQPLSSMNGAVLLDDLIASGSMGLQPGVVTSEAFRNWSGTLLPSLTIPKLVVLRISDMSTVLSLTNQATNGAGLLTITSSQLVPGVKYLVVTSDATGTAFGAEPYTAV